MSTYKNLMTICAVAALALGLAACGGGGSSTTSSGPPPVVEPEPTAYEKALAAINAADTAAAAQAAYDAVKGDVTAAEGEELQDAVDMRVAALETMARIAEQTMALSDAAGMIDTSDLSTQELVDAARMAIAGLRQAIADAVDVDDTSMYQSMLDDAVDAVDMAQGGIDTDTRRTNQMAALSGASDTLQAALAALSGTTPTQALLDAANNARTALMTAISAGADLTEAEKATYVREAANAAAPISTAQMAFDDAQDEADRVANVAMRRLASSLFGGIGTDPLGRTSATTAANTRTGAYGTGDNAADIAVTIGEANAVNLSEDEDATVDANAGWEGQKFTAAPDDGGGTYEAVVYSDVGDPEVTEGDPFNEEYMLSTDAATMGELTTLEAAAGGDGVERVASPSFDQSAGKKEFELPGNTVRVMISGSYHGVPGTYYCTPGTGTDCSATKADKGFTLAGGTWTFKPADPEQKLMDTSADDTTYASYGWWLHKPATGAWVASAFADNRGADPTALAIADLRGTATYTGGAAGHYSLFSLTGGENDAGQFTARVTLEAEFAEDHTISGTVDNFMGADGMARDWSVALMESTVSDTGGIAGDPETDGNTDLQATQWTIGERAALAGGSWSGNLQDDGDDGVPGIATGVFHSRYGLDGRMVGAFGANKQ